MRNEVKRELFIGLQYFIILLVAVGVAFFAMLPSGGNGEYSQAINIHEAWKDIEPYVYQVLLAFTVLSVARLHYCWVRDAMLMDCCVNSFGCIDVLTYWSA